VSGWEGKLCEGGGGGGGGTFAGDINCPVVKAR